MDWSVKERETTNLLFWIGPRKRHQDAVLVSSLASVGSKDFHVCMLMKQLREKLDLLSVQRKHAELVLLDPTCEESGSQLFGGELQIRNELVWRIAK